MSEAAAVGRAGAEIDDEVQRMRRSGRIPQSRLEELERRFGAHVPAQDSGSPLRQALDLADAATTLDEAVPLGSRLVGGGAVKRAVHRLVGWYVRFFVSQLHRGLWGVVRALHVLADAVEQLQQDAAGTPGDVAPAHQLPDTDTDDRSWWRPVLDAVMPADTEGVLSETAGRSTAADELRRFPPGALRGVVLRGSSQVGSLLGRARLVESAGAHLSSGGLLAVVSRTPHAWARSSEPLADDLAGTRPLHPATWVHLLERAGFEDVVVHRGGRDLSVAFPSGASSEPSPELSALAATVNTLVGGPDEYLVVGRRP